MQSKFTKGKRNVVLAFTSKGSKTKIISYIFSLTNIDDYNSVEVSRKMSHSGVKSISMQFAVIWLK